MNIHSSRQGILEPVSQIGAVSPQFGTRWARNEIVGLVSVVVPCYNSAQFLEAAAQSVLSQSYGDIELILGDDGSSDGTRDLIENLAKRDSRIRVLQRDSNVGPFALRNIGMQHSVGEFIAFLDADDTWDPCKLAQQLEVLRENPSAGFSHHFLVQVDAAGRTTSFLEKRSRRHWKEARAYDGHCFYKMLRRNGVALSSVVARRQVFAEVGPFDEAFRYRGDWEMWTRISQRFQVSLIPEVLGAYRVHDQNISLKTDVLRPYSFAILDKFATAYGLSALELEKYVEPSRVDLFREYGFMALVNRSYPQARNDLLRYLSHRPMDLTGWFGLVKSVVYPIFGVSRR